MTARLRPSKMIVSGLSPILEWKIGLPSYPGWHGFVWCWSPAVQPVSFVTFCPNIRTEIWGSHGGEQLRHDGSYELFTLEPVQQAALEEVRRELSALGFAEALEIKPSSLAVHWRSLEPWSRSSFAPLSSQSSAA